SKAKVDPNKKATDDPEPKEKEKKADPAPTNYPARKDFVDPSYGGVAHVTFIDDQIKKVWKENNTFPSERCSDHEFLRRASLDIIGRIPTLSEIGKFMSQPEEKRRSWVINEMLDGPSYGYGKEYAQNFANIWTVYLMTRTGSSKHHQAQMN